ncbi:MAG: hypothetical protein J7K40_09400 [candidate division Zixibacteria bacterium]|nr:hypothetical protein [candidate division Zixibacteria bacterium]
MPISNYPKGFANGINLRGLPILNTYPGKVFWVGTGGSNGNKGTFDRPFETIDYAIGRCTANRGDVILIKSNYYEEITTAADITVDIAGVTIIGMGRGSDMPMIDYGAAAASVSIAADNVAMQNINFHANVPEVVVGVDIQDGVDYAALLGCKVDVETTATDEFFISIQTNDASNFALIEGCDIDNGLGAAVHAIKFTKDTDGTIIRGCTIQGDYSTANIGGITTLSTKLDIDGNLLINGAATALNTEPVIELLTGSTGIVRNNYCVCDLATKLAAIAANSVLLFENYYNEDLTGTGGLIGVVSADD